MGNAKENEIRLMGFGFAALVLLAAVVLIVAAVRVAGDVRSQPAGPLVSQDGAAPLGLTLQNP